MVYWTNLKNVASNLGSCFHFVKDRESERSGGNSELVLVGHSAGGGLVQFALLNGMVRCRALCLVDSIPHCGAL